MKKAQVVLLALLGLIASSCNSLAAPPTSSPTGQQDFTFVVIGDTRGPTPIVQPKPYLDNIALINRLQPALVVNLGDLILGYTEDEPLIQKEWAEFDRVTARLKAPAYYAPGNHEVANAKLYDVYKQRYGKTYYSFDKDGHHFIILSSEEITSGETGKITGKQLEWLAQDLEAHKDAAHKFVFLHRPLWGSSEWDKNVHPLLAKYHVSAVYAGHEHMYQNSGLKDGVQYYITGGGGAEIGPNRQAGDFYHFMLTTVDGPKLYSVVIESNGRTRPDTIVTAKSAKTFYTLLDTLSIKDAEFTEGSREMRINQVMKNPYPQDIVVHYRWNTAKTGYRMTPASGRLVLPALGKTRLQVTARPSASGLTPLPVFTGTVYRNGVELAEISNPLRPIVRRKAIAERVNGAPLIDGVITNGEYGNTQRTGRFTNYKGAGTPSQGTEFMVSYDDKAVYVAVVARETQPQTIVANARERDGGVWEDDEIELFLDTKRDRKSYYQFAVNFRGDQLDGIGGPDHGTFGDVTWNGDWRAAVTRDKGQVVAEFAIPFKTLGVEAPVPGSMWGLNVCRSRQAAPGRKESELSAWAITYSNFHVPSHFGDVTFK